MSQIRYAPLEGEWRDRFNLHLNGYSYHVSSDKDDLNEFNYGIGAGYEIGKLEIEGSVFDNTLVSIEGELYKDSFSELGALFGVTLQKPVWSFLSVGVRVGLIHEDDLRRKVGSSVLPYIFPFAETRFEGPINLRVTVVPPVGNTTDGIVAAQIILRFK